MKPWIQQKLANDSGLQLWSSRKGGLPRKNQSKAASAKFQELEEEILSESDGEIDLDSILDVPVSPWDQPAPIPIKPTQLNPRGQRVELDRLAGEPMDVLSEQRLIAQEVVVVNEKFGIRLTM